MSNFIISDLESSSWSPGRKPLRRILNADEKLPLNLPSKSTLISLLVEHHSLRDYWCTTTLEASLNSLPLHVLSTPCPMILKNLSSLTPEHFLIGEPLNDLKAVIIIIKFTITYLFFKWKRRRVDNYLLILTACINMFVSVLFLKHKW